MLCAAYSIQSAARKGKLFYNGVICSAWLTARVTRFLCVVLNELGLLHFLGQGVHTKTSYDFAYI